MRDDGRQQMGPAAHFLPTGHRVAAWLQPWSLSASHSMHGVVQVATACLLKSKDAR
jgi:hypothetical protein